MIFHSKLDLQVWVSLRSKYLQKGTGTVQGAYRLRPTHRHHEQSPLDPIQPNPMQSNPFHTEQVYTSHTCYMLRPSYPRIPGTNGGNTVVTRTIFGQASHENQVKK